MADCMCLLAQFLMDARRVEVGVSKVMLQFDGPSVGDERLFESAGVFQSNAEIEVKQVVARRF